MYYKVLKLIFLLAICAILSACSYDLERNKVNYNCFVENYNFYGKKQNVGFSKEPEKIIVCGNSGIDTIIALGAGNKIVACVLTEPMQKMYYQKLLPNAKIYTQALSLESVTELQPDFILGWRRFFSDSGLKDTSEWISKGIPAYIQDASGPIPAKGNFPDSTVESEINFIRNMGIIFNKQEESKKYIDKINELLATKSKILKNNNKVLVVEFINGNIEVFGKDLLIGDVIKRFGGNIVEYKAPFISQEELINLDPNFIFVVYHGDKIEEQLAINNLKNPLYSHLDAVQKGKVYPLNYCLAVAPGINTIETIKYVDSCLKK